MTTPPTFNVTFTTSDGLALCAADADLLDRIATATLAEVSPLLPDLVATIDLVVLPCDTVAPDGMGGYAPTSDRIELRVACGATADPAAHIETHLRATLAHELHHCARNHVLGPPSWDFVDVVVFEGLATAFERDVTGTVPYYGSYADVPIAAWADEVLALDDAWDRAHWRFAHPDGRTNIAYRVGAFIADAASAATGRSAAALVSVPAPTVLAHAGLTRPEVRRDPGAGRDR